LPNTKITNLTSLTAASGDEIPVNRAGSDGKISVGDIGGALAASYTVTGAELVTGGDLAIDPSGAPGWTLGGSPSFAAGSLTWTYVATPISASITVPVTLTSGSYYVIEVHHTVTAGTLPQMLFLANTGFFQRGEGTAKAVFRASATGADSFFMSISLNASGHSWIINSVSIKEIDAPGLVLYGTDTSGAQLIELGDLNNIVLGHAAGGQLTTGYSNIALGDEALYSGVSCFFNTAIGQGALGMATMNNNTAIGARSLSNCSTGGTNTAVGRSAGSGITTGSNNCCIGFSGGGISTGSYNIAVGHNALLTGPTTGAENIAIGHDPLKAVTSGAGNIAIGAAYLALTTGSNNIAIGGVKDVSNVGGTLTTGSGNILIGAGLDVAANGTSDYLNIGNLIKADMSTKTLTNGVNVVEYDNGTVNTGTLTPVPSNGAMQRYTNGGAHTLAPTTLSGAYYLTISNNSTAGAITTSGWTKVAGDSFTTVNAAKFRCCGSISTVASLLVVQALQ
jgi:hypothetical protein